MNNLIINSVFSTTKDLKNWQPESAFEVYSNIEIDIGYSNQDGSSIFYVQLATPESLRLFREGPCLVKNRTLIMSEYSYSSLLSTIEEIVSSCNRDSWKESCQELMKYFLWEIENYQIETSSTRT